MAKTGKKSGSGAEVVVTGVEAETEVAKLNIGETDLISFIVTEREKFLKAQSKEAKARVAEAKKAYKARKKEFRGAFRGECEAAVRKEMGTILASLQSIGMKKLMIRAVGDFPDESSSAMTFLGSVSDIDKSYKKEKDDFRDSRHSCHPGVYMYQSGGRAHDSHRDHMIQNLLHMLGDVTLISKEFSFKMPAKRANEQKKILDALNKAWNEAEKFRDKIYEELRSVNNMERLAKSALIEKTFSVTDAGQRMLETAREIARRPVE